MELIDVKTMIEKESPDAEVMVDKEGCGGCSECSIRWLLLFKKQQLGLEPVKEPLATGELHAFSVIATYAARRLIITRIFPK